MFFVACYFSNIVRIFQIKPQNYLGSSRTWSIQYDFEPNQNGATVNGFTLVVESSGVVFSVVGLKVFACMEQIQGDSELDTVFQSLQIRDDTKFVTVFECIIFAVYSKHSTTCFETKSQSLSRSFNRVALVSLNINTIMHSIKIVFNDVLRN